MNVIRSIWHYSTGVACDRIVAAHAKLLSG